MTAAEASVREISASSYGFADALVANFIPSRHRHCRSASPPRRNPIPLAPIAAAFGAFLVRRSDLFTSNTADVAARTTNDGAGHAMGFSGMVVVERLEPDASGSLMNLGRRVATHAGREWLHSWSLLSSASGRALAAK